MDRDRIDAESAAVRNRYASRSDDYGESSIYHPTKVDRLLIRHQKEMAIAKRLRTKWAGKLSGVRVLEVGCGGGQNLQMFITLGLSPQNLRGIELLEDRVEMAKRLLPSATEVVCGDIGTARFAPESFDIVMQSTVMSSILDSQVRIEIARLLWGWLRPGGDVLWYDLAFDNPKNPDVVGIRRGEISSLFPARAIEFRRMTLAPPIARRVAPFGAWAYRCLESIPVLRSHTMAWIEKASNAENPSGVRDVSGT